MALLAAALFATACESAPAPTTSAPLERDGCCARRAPGTATPGSATVADAPAPPTSRAGGRYFAPDVVLTTHTGEKVRFYDDLIRDKVVVITFMYTRCTGVCPRIVENMRAVKALLGDRVGTVIQFYSITVDPENDTPDVLARYAAEHELGPAWTLLTGSRRDVKTIADLVEPEMMSGDDRSRHTSIMIYGNDRLDRWGACPAVGRPDLMVEEIQWVLPGREKVVAPPCANRPLGDR